MKRKAPFKVGDTVTRINGPNGDVHRVKAIYFSTFLGFFVIQLTRRRGEVYCYQYRLAEKIDKSYYAICLKKYFGMADGFIEVTKMDYNYQDDKFQVNRTHKKASIFESKQDALTWAIGNNIKHKLEFPIFKRKVYA